MSTTSVLELLDQGRLPHEVAVATLPQCLFFEATVSSPLGIEHLINAHLPAGCTIEVVTYFDGSSQQLRQDIWRTRPSGARYVTHHGGLELPLPDEVHVIAIVHAEGLPRQQWLVFHITIEKGAQHPVRKFSELTVRRLQAAARRPDGDDAA